MKHLIFLIPILFLIGCRTSPKPYVELKGEFQKWHKLTLLISGPEISEYADENPFLDYKLEVNFSSGDLSYSVPGYYAADGFAGESSAREGNVWKVHFRPDAPGTWTYSVSFRKGKIS